MSKPKLALIPSGYKSGKVYSILPNDATGDFDFTRQSIGTRVRKDGLIEEAKTVGSITNLILNSENFSTNWTNFNGASISTDQALAPDGTNTADKIVSNGTNYSFTRPTSNITVTNAKYYTASIYVKADVETVGYIRCDYGTLIYNRKFDLSAGTLSTGFDNTANIPEAERIEELANGWYRVSITDVVNTVSFEMRIYCSDGSASSGDSLFLWGAMVSEGALSDYIKTEGSQETKTVETFTDVPRLDWYNSNCPSLLLEPQRTNQLEYSDEFDNSVWLKDDFTVTTNQKIAPNGTLTADEVFENSATSARFLYQNISVTSGNDYTISFFVKYNSIQYLQLASSTGFSGSEYVNFDIINGTITKNPYNTVASIKQYSNNWFRISITETSTTTTTGRMFFASIPSGTSNRLAGYEGNTSNSFYLWGGQMEQGTYPTSYIKTEASTVTRLKDLCIIDNANNLFDITEGTFFIDVIPFDANANHFITLSDGSNDNRIQFVFRGNGTQYNLFIEADDTFVLSRDISITFDIRNKIAITFKQNEFKIYTNGTLSVTQTSGNVPINLDRYSFSISVGGSEFQGKVYDTRVYDRVLTEAEAIELTTL